MVSEYLAWRERERIDEVLSEGPLAPVQQAALDECFRPRMLAASDLKGRPVLFMQVTDFD